MWILYALSTQDLLNLISVTLGLLIIFIKYELRTAERKWRKSRDASDCLLTVSLCYLPFLLQSPLPKRHSTKKKLTKSDSRKLFSTFNNLLNSLPLPSVTSLFADHFTTFLLQTLQPLVRNSLYTFDLIWTLEQRSFSFILPIQ